MMRNKGGGIMHGKDLVDYLSKQGFVIKGISSMENLSEGSFGMKQSNGSQGLPVIRIPLVNGLRGVSLPQCQNCDKKFASKAALSVHVATVCRDAKQLDIVTKSIKQEAAETENVYSSQYQIEESDFLIDDTGAAQDENQEEFSYLIIKTEVSANSVYSNNRRPRRPETKPRKQYETKLKRDQNTHQVQIKIHPGLQGPYKCVECEEKYEKCCEYSRHFHNQHLIKKKPFSRCQICEKKVSCYPGKRTSQLSPSEPDPPVQCTVCDSSFPSRVELDVHKRSAHSNVKPFQCILCPKTFTLASGLHQHLKVHTGLRPFQCDKCDKTFTHKSGLEQHMRVHSKERPFICVVCGGSFRQASHLAQHMRVHTSLRPFRCPYCPRRFKQSGQLSFHVKGHTNKFEVQMDVELST